MCLLFINNALISYTLLLHT